MSGSNGNDGRRGRPRADASFGELPPPIELTSLFDDGYDTEANPPPRAATGRDDVQTFAALPRAGDQPARSGGWDGTERRAAALGDTSPLPRVHAPRTPDALTPPKQAPTNPSPRVRPAEKASAPARAVWPSVDKQRRRKAAPPPAKRRRVRATVGGVRRTVRTVRRVSTLASMLPLLGWIVVPLLLLVVVLVGSRGGTDDATGTSTAATGAAPATTGSAATARASTPAASASATPAPSGTGAVQVDITLEDSNGVAKSVSAVVLLGDRTLTPTTVRLPLTLTGSGRPGERLTVLVPQPPAGSHLVCTVAASGAVTGAMTREETDGMLDCTSTLADIATGGT